MDEAKQNKEKIKQLLWKVWRPGDDCWSDFGSLKSNSSILNENNISLDTSRNLVFPRARDLNESVHEKSLEIVQHFCPKPETVIDNVIDFKNLHDP